MPPNREYGRARTKGLRYNLIRNGVVPYMH